MSRASLRAALALLGCSLCLAASPALAAGCTPLLPAEPLSGHLVDIGNGMVSAQDLCYAAGAHWREADPHDDTRNLTLYQRFDYYRPKQAPLTQPMPLVIWAHPNGQTEKLNLTRGQQLVAPAAQAGFAFISIEFRHPVGSQLAATEPPTPPNLDVPHTDIARAVQWVRSRAQQLGIDANNIFLLGQSRGSLGVLTALMPDQMDIGSGTDYLRFSSRVNAVFAAQAQTTYDHARVRDTFIVASDWPTFDDPLLGYPFFHHPGSALDEVSDDDPPVMLRYERAPTDAQRVVPLHMANADGSCTPDPKVPGGCFDVHHPNFGLALRQVFDQHPAIADKLVVQYEVPSAHFFDGYICFFGRHLTPGGKLAAAQAGGQMPQACNP